MVTRSGHLLRVTGQDSSGDDPRTLSHRPQYSPATSCRTLIRANTRGDSLIECIEGLRAVVPSGFRLHAGTQLLYPLPRLRAAARLAFMEIDFIVACGPRARPGLQLGAIENTGNEPGSSVALRDGLRSRDAPRPRSAAVKRSNTRYHPISCRTG